ncbi:MAG: nucleotidyl transferase AbiEii/AbiGii toxin family protein [Methanosarcinales archaeon]
MQEQEILAEKIRALFTRSKAKDLYDTWLLLKKGIKTNSEIIQQKLKVVKKPISEIKISEKEWHQDLDILLPHTPDFNRVHSEVISVLNTIDKFIKNLS